MYDSCILVIVFVYSGPDLVYLRLSCRVLGGYRGCFLTPLALTLIRRLIGEVMLDHLKFPAFKQS
jgi:hypothetical protein